MRISPLVVVTTVEASRSRRVGRWVARGAAAALVLGLLICSSAWKGRIMNDSDSRWTTTVTTWARVYGEPSPEWTVRESAGEWADEFDVDGAADEYVATINGHLDGLHVTRSGDVYGPVGMSASAADAAIRAVAGDPDIIDMGVIFDRHPATAE